MQMIAITVLQVHHQAIVKMQVQVLYHMVFFFHDKSAN